MKTKRLVLFAVVLLALLATGWWGIETFVASGEGSGPGEGDDSLLRRPAGTSPPSPPPDRPRPRDEEPTVRTMVGTTTTTPPASGVPGADEETAPGDRRETPSPTRSPDDADPPAEADGPRPTTSVGHTTALRDGDVTVGNTSAVPEDAEVWVPGGGAWIGTPVREVGGMLSARGRHAPPGLAYEAPDHSIAMEGFWIERTEVTNARYREFLVQHASVRFRTPLGDARTLLEVVATLMGSRAPSEWDIDATARQFYVANRAALHAARPDLVVYDATTRSVNEDETWQNVREARLPTGLDLTFYDRPPPRPWPSDTFAVGRARHPVHGLSLDDATEFALWAGRHVPTEFQWEYAARGSRGWDYPWGNDAQPFEERVNGGRTRDQGEIPDTVVVTTLADGASWVEALNMLGNVAEWTSSWLDPYPGSRLPPLRHPVHRGGSAADEDRLVVRPAFRGWTRDPDDEDEALLPDQPRPWVGLRLARYEEPVRSRLVAMHTRVRSAGLVHPDALEGRVFAGVQGTLRRIAFTRRQDPTVRRGAKAIVVQPLTAVSVRGMTPRFRPGVPPTIADLKSLGDLSETTYVLLGLLHVDLRIMNAYEVMGTRSRRLRLRRQPCPPGTWVVGLHRGHLALFPPGFGEIRYLTRNTAPASIVNVMDRTARRDGRPHSMAKTVFRPESGRVDVFFEVPLAGAARPDLVVSVRSSLLFEKDVIRVIEDWEEGSGTSNQGGR